MKLNPPVPPPGTRVGPYVVESELGRGGMAVVVGVRHHETGVARAIKMMLPGGRAAEVARRFRREFRSLSRLDHPGVLRVFDGGVWQDRPWFAMERLKGKELGTVVAEWKQLPPAERFRLADGVLVQVARALEYVHARGIVHRDITPSNIMIEPDGKARLMDFGVVTEHGGDLTRVGEVVGTVAYIAPEQINGTGVDARADLYSLGAVYYLMLTGRRPFNARTLAGYMDKHLHRPVRPPREVVPTVPNRADEICVRLLAKDPADRFASATHLLHVLHAGGNTAGLPPSDPDNLPLVGRGAELVLLREAIARLAADQGGAASEGPQPRGGVVLVEGDLGMGMTRMLDEAENLARQRGLPVTRAKNRDPSQRLFDGIAPLLRDLQASHPERPLPAALDAAFGDTEAAARAKVQRYSVQSAMRDLALRDGVRVVILADLDRADRGTLELTEYLVRNLLSLQDHPWLFLLGRRVEAGPDRAKGLMSGSSTGVPVTRINLSALTQAAVEELLLLYVDDSPQVGLLARRLHKEGEGNPYFVGEMLRDLVEQGVITAREGGGRGQISVDYQALQTLMLPVPPTVREAIRAQLAPLSDDAKAVAGALAAARQEVSLGLLMEAVAFDEDRVLQAADALLEAGLIRERRVGTAEHFELARNRLRDVVTEAQPVEVRVGFHRRIGVALERSFRRNAAVVVESLAWHFEMGEMPAKAYPYLLEAARKLIRRTFVAEAVQYLDRARAIEVDAREFMTLDDADRRLAELELTRAEALFHLGHWTAAREAGLAAHLLATDLDEPRLMSRVAAQIACHARQAHDLDGAAEWLRVALDRAEQVGDKGLQIMPLYELGAVQWTRGDVAAARDYFEQSLAGSEAYQDERSLALGYNGLGLLALCQGKSAEARRYLEQAIAVCEKHGLMERLGVSRANLVELYHLTGNLRRALELSDSAVNHAREVAHRYGIGLGLRYRVLVLIDLGRITEAIENAEEALRIQRGLANQEEELGALVMLARARLAAGEHEAAAQALGEIVPLLREFDSEGFGPVVHAWRGRLFAQAGDHDAARAAIAAAWETPGRRWPHQAARLRLNLARVHEILGERADASELAEEALRAADTSGYRYYAMRARQIACRVSDDPVQAGRHRRVADALARSLAASLPKDDRDSFLRIQGVVRRQPGAPVQGSTLQG